MRLFPLPSHWIILLDFAAWLVLQLTIGYVMSRLPVTVFDPCKWPYRTFSWERNGKIYETMFGVRRWKQYLPSAGKVFGDFSLARITSLERAYFERYLAETCRAELTHWLQIGVVPFFLLWNPWSAFWLNCLYAIVINLPCIISQRYNRPRVRRIYAKASRRRGR